MHSQQRQHRNYPGCRREGSVRTKSMFSATLPLLVPICTMLLAGARPVQAEESSVGVGVTPVGISTGESYSYLGQHLEYWHDRSGGSIPIARTGPALAVARSQEFEVSRSDILNFGVADGVVWVRFALRNDLDRAIERWIVVENPRLWEIDLSELNVPGSANSAGGVERPIRHRRMGISLPFGEREVLSPPFYFGIELAPGETRVCYMRFYNRTTMQLPIALITRETLEFHSALRRYMYGAYFGFLVALLLYNLLLYVTLRDRNHLYYVLLLFFMALFTSGFSGQNYQFLIPNYPLLNHASMPALGLLGLFSVTLFTQDFLHTASTTPRLHRFLKIVGFAFLVALGFSLAGDVQRATVLATIFSTILAIGMIYGATRLWRRKGYEPARYYLISWGVFYAAILVHGAIQFGAFTNGFLLNHALMIGSALATLLLSLGMAARIKALDRARFAVLTQMEVAKDIQRSLLPPASPGRDEIVVGYLYEPMEAVGGDFIDMHIREDGQALFTVADVTGHGVPAALLSSMIKMALRVSYEAMEDPGLALSRLHEAIKDKLASHHITVCFCNVDLSSGRLRHASAGHLPPLVIRRDGSVEVLECAGMLLHPLLSPSSESREARLEPGDRLVLYTDGITETVNQAGKLFGEDRFQILVGELRDLPPAEMVREIFQYTRLYSGSHRASLPDDFTLLVVEYRGPDYVDSDLPRHGETAGERAISR